MDIGDNSTSVFSSICGTKTPFSHLNSSAELKFELSLRRRTATRSDRILTRRTKVVMVRPSQSPMLKAKKQHTEIKKRSAVRTNKCLTISFRHVTVYMSIWVECSTYFIENSEVRRLDHTPFLREYCFHICCYSWEDGQSDCEHKCHAERHHPDLKTRDIKCSFNGSQKHIAGLSSQLDPNVRPVGSPFWRPPGPRPWLVPSRPAPAAGRRAWSRLHWVPPPPRPDRR